MTVKNTQHLLYISLTLLLLYVSPNSYATWFQGSAEQQIPTVNYNFDAIRASTIKQAITNASLKSGASITSESIVLDGLLQSSKSVLKIRENIRRVEIISESINNNLLTVIVKIDIDTTSSCQQDDYTKSILITQFQILNSLRAQNGELFDLGNQISKRFDNQLRNHEKISDSLLLQQAFSSSDQLITLDQQKTLKTAYYLGTEYSSQFIVFGYIQDVSLFEQVKDNILIDDVSLRRNFTFQLYLYDALQGHLLLNKRYHGEADWLFSQHQQIDTNNSVFWRSDFGRVVLNTVNSAVVDIIDSISCQSSFTQIINKSRNTVTINWGAKHGVKMSDEFYIVKKQSPQQDRGNIRPILIPNHDVTFQVKHINSHSSVLESNSLSAVHESQLFDLITPKSEY